MLYNLLMRLSSHGLMSSGKTYTENGEFSVPFLLEHGGKKLGLLEASFDAYTQDDVGRSYLKRLTREFHKVGVKVIILYPDEVVFKEDIVCSRILNYFNLNENIRVFARNTQCMMVDKTEKKKFMNMYHVQGDSVSKVNLGLFDKNKNCVAQMSFNKPRVFLKNGGYNWELNRFATNPEFSVPGAASKLLSHFRKNYNGNIVTFCDLRWSGYERPNLYDTIGFSFVSETDPNYYYVSKDDHIRHHRWSFTKASIKKKFPEHFNESLSEYDNMLKLGYKRLWDCGSYKYEIITNKLWKLQT